MFECVDLKIAVPAKSRSLHTILCRRDPRRTAIWPHIILYVRTAILPGPRFCVLGIRLQNRGPTVTVKIAVLARSRSSPLVGINMVAVARPYYTITTPPRQIAGLSLSGNQYGRRSAIILYYYNSFSLSPRTVAGGR